MTTKSQSGVLDMRSMVKASQALSGEVALDKLLPRMMDIVAENAAAERGALVLTQGGGLVVAAEFNTQDGVVVIDRPELLSESTHLSLSIVTYVIRAQESVVLRDATVEGAFTGDAYVTNQRPKAVLCLPLLNKGEAHGALYLENNLVPGVFTGERAEFLGILCAQVAISIENAYLYAGLEQKVQERTSALEETQARLVKLEKKATEVQMAGGFAHEMRNALTSAMIYLATVHGTGSGGEAWSACAKNLSRINMLFAYLRERLAEDELKEVAAILLEMSKGEAQLDKVLNGLDGALKRGLSITALILDYARIGNDQPGSEAVSLSTLVALVLRDIEVDLSMHRISVETEIPASCEIFGNEQHFFSILMNLVLNARDALLEVKDDRPKKIVIRGAVEHTRVVISVCDTGVGIPLELQEVIFQPFLSTKANKGMGLGLAMTRKLASLYGGVIEFESVPSCGTTFRLILPRQQEMAPSVPSE
jgi:signal transduction histidine kinase